MNHPKRRNIFGSRTLLRRRAGLAIRTGYTLGARLPEVHLTFPNGDKATFNLRHTELLRQDEGRHDAAKRKVSTP